MSAADNHGWPEWTPRPEQQRPEQALADVMRERSRQVTAEGYSAEHDDKHVDEEIAYMACYYAMPPTARAWNAGLGETFGEAVQPAEWTPKAFDRRSELVKAGALILAEIERLDRAAAGKEQAS